MAGVCLHRGGPLGQGALHGNHVVCPWHAWEWDCRTGANGYNPDQKLAKYPVKIEGEDILIDIP
jgi:nitrite reductase (NADH) small subunit